jgi:hypothetical protein
LTIGKWSKYKKKRMAVKIQKYLQGKEELCTTERERERERIIKRKEV